VQALEHTVQLQSRLFELHLCFPLLHAMFFLVGYR
jgi:hypothetical protein